jgi:H+/gluconate symporter-like permease
VQASGFPYYATGLLIMTKENWITIAQVLATFIAAFTAPLLNSWLQHKLALAREKPNINQQRDKNTRKTRWSAYHLIQFGMFILSIIVPLCILLRELLRTGPIDRSDVFNIAFWLALITFGTVTILKTALVNKLATPAKSPALELDTNTERPSISKQTRNEIVSHKDA